jgi:hypothetical protein
MDYMESFHTKALYPPCPKIKETKNCICNRQNSCYKNTPFKDFKPNRPRFDTSP